MLETGTSEHRTSGFALTVAHGSALLPKSGALCGRLFDEKSASKGRRSCSWRLVNASQRRGMVDRIGSALIEEGQIDGVDRLSSSLLSTWRVHCLSIHQLSR